MATRNPSGPVTVVPQPTLASSVVTFLNSGVGAISRYVQDRLRDLPKSIKDFGVASVGAAADGVLVSDASISSGSSTLTSSSLTSADAGKLIVVFGAGASSSPLTGTIVSASAGSATLSVTASTTVSNAGAYWATDSTSAIQACLDAHLDVYMPPGYYGITRLRLRQGHRLLGSGLNVTYLLKLGTGAGGATLAMTSGQTAEHMDVGDFSVFCGQLGTNLAGIELGTETPGTTDFAFGSVLHDIRVYSASGPAFSIQSNAGRAHNLWASSFPATGTPDAMSCPNTQAFLIAGSTLVAYGLHPEGRYELDVMSITANFVDIETIHCELTGSYGTKDIISVTGNANLLKKVLALNHGTSVAVRRDLVRLAVGVTLFDLNQSAYQDSGGGSLTVSTHINDLQKPKTVAAATTTLEGYNPNRETGVSGTYTPTPVGVANIDSTTGATSQWMRVGDVITVSGEFDANTTAGGSTGTDVAIPLPVASDFTLRSHGNGTAFCAAINQGAQIYADTTNNRMLVEWLASDTSNRTWSFIFTYRVL